MKISSTENVNQGPIRVVIYGAQGAGKTSIAKTLEGKTLILSLENGLLSLKGSGVHFPYVDLTKDENENPYSSPSEKFNATVAALRDPSLNEYDNVVLDSLTQFGLITKLYIEDSFKNEVAKNKFFLWDQIASITTGFINYINDNMKCNFIVLCQESLDKDDENRMYYAPDYPGKASMPAIMGLFDEVYRLTSDLDQKRWLNTQPTNRVKAKSRGASAGSLLPIEPADLGAIFKKIRQQPKPPQGGEVKKGEAVK